AAAEAGQKDQIDVRCVGCLRLCRAGPLVVADPSGALFEAVTPADAPALVGFLTGGAGPPRRGNWDHPFFTGQLPIVLAGSGTVEPERTESAIAFGAYASLYKAVRQMTPARVIEEVTRSGLRGRGGAGYPTGLKWSQVARQPAPRKFVICNADEGDPGAYM